MMYEQFYGFVQSPFSLTPDPRFLYRSESHEEAFTLLLHSLRRKEAFVVLTGDIGTGKTTTCRALFEQLDAKTFTSLVLNPFLSVEELLAQVLLDFGVVSHDAVRMGRLAGATRHELFNTLHDFLRSLVPIQGSAVLVIDEAQHLSREVLEEIRILSNLETDRSKLLQVVLVGQLTLLDLLADTDMRQLDQRIAIRAQLKPLGRDDVEAYIFHRLDVAQGPGTVTFESKALDLVHRISDGIPRVINLVCDRALMVGARMQVTLVTTPMVEEAIAKLGLKMPGTAARSLRIKTRRLLAAAAVALALPSIILVAPLHRLVQIGSPGLPAPPPAPPRAQPVAPPGLPTADFLPPPPAAQPPRQPLPE